MAHVERAPRVKAAARAVNASPAACRSAPARRAAPTAAAAHVEPARRASAALAGVTAGGTTKAPRGSRSRVIQGVGQSVPDMSACPPNLPHTIEAPMRVARAIVALTSCCWFLACEDSTPLGRPTEEGTV